MCSYKNYKYTINFLSYHPHPEESIYRVLELKSLKKIVFPASCPAPAPMNFVEVNSAQQVAEKDCLSYHSPTSTTNISLLNESGTYCSIRTTCETSLMNSAIVIKFEDNQKLLQSLNTEFFEFLFSEIVPIFKPYYASVYDNRSRTRYLPSGQHMIYRDKLSQRDYPFQINWITYFGLEILETLGVERFRKLETCCKKYQLFQGVLIVLQEEAFEESNSLHRERREQAERELGVLDFFANSE